MIVPKTIFCQDQQQFARFVTLGKFASQLAHRLLKVVQIDDVAFKLEIIGDPLDTGAADVETVIVGQLRFVPERLLRGLQWFALPGIAKVRGDRQQLAFLDSRAERLRMVGKTGEKLTRFCRGFGR